VARRPLERERVYRDGGRRTTQLMRDSLGGTRMTIAQIRLLLSVMACVAPGAAAAQAEHPDTLPNHSDSNTILLTPKDITPPTVQECPRFTGLTRHGTVMVATIVDTLGHAELHPTRILKSSDDSLSTLALRATLLCTFKPGRYRGKAIRVAIHLPFNF